MCMVRRELVTICGMMFQDDQKSEVVHKLAMNMQSSFDKFKDKVLDGNRAGMCSAFRSL